jgi:hypothetical protein
MEVPGSGIGRRGWTFLGFTQFLKEEGQRGRGREQDEKKSWLLGRHGEKLNNSAKTA